MGLNANTKVNIKQQNEHQVPNIERVRKNDQNDPALLLPNLGGSEAIWGFSPMPQIKTKHKSDFKQNKQSLSFS